MSNFEDRLRERIAIINQMISGAKSAERRKLQRERSDLEVKLQKVTT